MNHDHPNGQNKSPDDRCRVVKRISIMFFLSGIVFNTYAHSHLQIRIDLKYKDIPIKDVFAEIEKRSDYIFLFSGNLEEEINRKIDVDISSDSIEEILECVMKNTSLKYEILDKQIVVFNKAHRPKAEPTEEIRKISVPQSVKTLFISGKVTDEKEEPIVGANVIVPGTTIGTVTDKEGKFALNVPKGSVLRFSCIGYIPSEVIVSEQKTLNIRLKEKKQALDEVVITGYADIRKESFTGSVTQINRDDILKVSQNNIINAIQIFDPGFRLTENIEMGSNPNSLPEFYIRGQSGLPAVKELDLLENPNVSQFSLKTNPNTPIFILDGFEVSVERIYDIDISHIKNITLLKDASSTAIYGSRAANGVIVIETISPKAGELRINYYGSYALTAPDLTSYNLMNAEQKLQSEQDAGFFGDPAPWEYRYSDFETQRLNKHINYIYKHNQILKGVDTYWLSQPLRSVLNHKHSIYMEGGVNALRYGIELAYRNENGVMKKSYRNRKGIGLTLEYSYKNISIQNRIDFNIMSNEDSPYGNFDSYIMLQPYWEPRDAQSGEYIQSYNAIWGATRSMPNPLYEASLGNYNRGNYKEWTDNLSFNWYIGSHLLVKGQYAVTFNESEYRKFTDPESTRYAKRDELLKKGELTIEQTKKLKHNINLFSAYNLTDNQHYVNISLGFNLISGYFDHSKFQYRGFPNKNLSEPAYAYEITGKPYFSDNKTRLLGSFLTVNYSYQNIYFIDGSTRIDGSSEFGTERKWAPFWSVGIGLNIHNYPFFKNKDKLKILRLTANTGRTGKSNFAPYMASNMFKIMNDDWYPTGIGAGLIHMGNKKLTWEKNLSKNLALDIATSRYFTFRFEIYDKITDDLIGDVSLPSSSGFKIYKENIGKISNKGFESKMNFNIIDIKHMSLNFFANLSHNTNKIHEISETLKRYNERIDNFFEKYRHVEDPAFHIIYHKTNKIYSKPLKKFEEGNSLTSIYGMKSLGINPANGKEVYIKRDGSITYDWKSSEQQDIGNTEPWGQGAFGLNMRYGNWTLYTSFLYEFGGDRYNQTLVNSVENVDLMHTNADKRVGTARWKKPGDISPLKNIKEGLIITRSTSRFIQRNNYVKFHSFNLGYDFTPRLIKKYGLRSLKLQLNINDILLFSTIKREMGTAYPYARTFTLTLNTSF